MSDTPVLAVGRRALLQTLVGGAGLGLALPSLGESHPMHEHLHDQSRVSAADAKAKTAAWKPEFLNAHQVETVTILAEQIVPGSTKAKSAQFIDALLAVDTEQRQRRFVQALGAFEAHGDRAGAEAMEIVDGSGSHDAADQGVDRRIGPSRRRT